jgi:glutamyl-Q tRNA(Asp) synthetase
MQGCINWVARRGRLIEICLSQKLYRANSQFMPPTPRYIGRFAPSPTGALHAGSLAAALASWLDARSHGGQWLVRIEDVDTPRCIPGADLEILRQLAACGLMPDAPPVYQSQRSALYQAALNQLKAQGQAYACSCSRKDIEAAWAARGIRKARHEELIYPGTCRPERDVLQNTSGRAWRFHTEFWRQKRLLVGKKSTSIAIENIADQISKQGAVIAWQDRRLGAQQQDVAQDVGDFVLQRADGLWAYQLAVVVDDAAQGITHIVRGQDLADNTPRQIMLQRALAYPKPSYLHTPLVLAADGQKLSKQNGAAPLALLGQQEALQALQAAALALDLQAPPMLVSSLADSLQYWVTQWQQKQLDSQPN